MSFITGKEDPLYRALIEELLSRTRGRNPAGVVLGDKWRIVQGPYPTASSPVVVKFQLLEGTMWVTKLVINAGGSTGGGFHDNEVPTGAIDGVNAVFTLVASPNPSLSLCLYLNGVLQKVTTNFTLAGNVITYTAGSVPQTGDIHVASYRT